MFGDFLRKLSDPGPEPLPQDDSRLALAALLVRIARSDGRYETGEVKRIDRLLAERYGLSAFEVVKLRTDAEALELEAPDTVRFTRAIKDAVPYDDRAKVMEDLWGVVLADGRRDEEEDALMRMIGPMLGVNDRDSAFARQTAEQKS